MSRSNHVRLLELALKTRSSFQEALEPSQRHAARTSENAAASSRGDSPVAARCRCKMKIMAFKLSASADTARSRPSTAASIAASHPEVIAGDPAAFLACSKAPRIRLKVERFGRRGTEPFELFRSEFGQNSGSFVRIHQKLKKNQGCFTFSTIFGLRICLKRVI